MIIHLILWIVVLVYAIWAKYDFFWSDDFFKGYWPKDDKMKIKMILLIFLRKIERIRKIK